MLSVPMFMTAFIRLPLSLFGWIALAALAVFGYRTGFNMIGGINKWIDDGEERVRAGIMGSIAAIVVWFWCHGNILFNYLEDTYVLYMNTNGKDDSSAKDYHKSLAGLGRVYADAVNQQNSTSPWQYYVATWTMFAVGAVICFLLVASCLRIRKSYKERLAAWNADTFENRFTPVSLENGVAWAASGETNYLGFKLVDHDAGGSADPWYEPFETINLHQARHDGRLNGVPGCGLESSPFDSDAIASGRSGEETLARIIVGNGLNVMSFWSLYGKDAKGEPTDKDIDCVLVGIDKLRRLHVWFVDAKNYKGGSDTKYVNVGHNADGNNMIARISKSKHALIEGNDGKPVLGTSANMADQAANWRHAPEIASAERKSYICMVSTGKDGIPDVGGLVWTGGIKCVTPKQLVDEIRECDLDDPAKIPTDVIGLFRSSLKH